MSLTLNYYLKGFLNFKDLNLFNIYFYSSASQLKLIEVMLFFINRISSAEVGLEVKINTANFLEKPFTGRDKNCNYSTT